MSDIPGWRAAEDRLRHVHPVELKQLLTDLTRTAGVRGAPGLTFLAGELRHRAGVGQSPVPPARLLSAEVEFIRGRAEQLLAPHADQINEMRKGR